MAIVLGQSVKNLPTDGVRLDLDSVWQDVFGSKASDTSPAELSDKVNLANDAMVTILIMVRAMLNYSPDDDVKIPEWMNDYPLTMTQFLFYLYHNLPDNMPAFMNQDVLTALAGTLFPTLENKAKMGLLEDDSAFESTTSMSGDVPGK